MAMWITVVAAKDIYNKVKHRRSLADGVRKLSRSYYAMLLAHIGLAVSIVGVAMVSNYSEERDLRMAPGDKLNFEDYSFEFRGSRRVEGANYVADVGDLVVYKKGQEYGLLQPEKRQYLARGNVMTEADIDPGFWGDLYVAMGEPLEGGAWAIRVQYKPFVRWIWLGGIMMTAGGLLAASDPRYRRKRTQPRVDMVAVS